MRTKRAQMRGQDFRGLKPVALLMVVLVSLASQAGLDKDSPVVVENKRFRLTIGGDARPQSLLHKPTGEECLKTDTICPLCTVSFLRREGGTARFDEQKGDHLSRCEKNVDHTLFSSSIERKGRRLLIGFEGTTDTLVLKLKVTSHYVGFTVEKLTTTGGGKFRGVTFFQLPVKNRSHFGDWLNVMWDQEVAVNILGSGPKTLIRSSRRTGHRVMQAAGKAGIGLRNIGAVLVVSRPDELLNCISTVERDYNLPPGAKRRQEAEYPYSYYWCSDISPANVDKHISYAKACGFEFFCVYYTSFVRYAGHFPWNDSYPNGMEDLKKVVHRIKSADLTPGVHIHYNKAHKKDPYVRDGPDHRLHLRRTFTLAGAIGPDDKRIKVEENPEGVTLEPHRRILQIGRELVQYESYTTERPYEFVVRKRGYLGSRPGSHGPETRAGVLDVDTWHIFVRFDQRTSIQEEAASRLAAIYKRAGFKFVYYDGAEDVYPPDWYYVSRAMQAVHSKLKPQPLFAAAATFSHFTWHILTQGNEWDLHVEPAGAKQRIRENPASQAPRMGENFTVSVFGRMPYKAGIQPDMLEYLCSRAAAWDCPVCLRGYLDAFEANPRTPDNVRVIRRWQTARKQGWLTGEKRKILRNLDQEHVLLRTEKGSFELRPYERIPNVGDGNSNTVRAFIFERRNHPCVVYWHTEGRCRIELPLSEGKVRLRERIGGPARKIESVGSKVVLPASGRRYLEGRNLRRKDLIEAFQEAKIVPGKN